MCGAMKRRISSTGAAHRLPSGCHWCKQRFVNASVVVKTRKAKDDPAWMSEAQCNGPIQ